MSAAVMRLAATPESAAAQRSRSAPAHAPCLECGGSLCASKRRNSEFCSRQCRKAWNNRRMTRGAQLYDLFMVCRFDRPTAADMKLWKFLNRMASEFREEDLDRRDGRPSWRRPDDVLDSRPYLRAHKSRI